MLQLTEAIPQYLMAYIMVCWHTSGPHTLHEKETTRPGLLQHFLHLILSHAKRLLAQHVLVVIQHQVAQLRVLWVQRRDVYDICRGKIGVPY